MKFGLFPCFILNSLLGTLAVAESPDISTVAPDLFVPECTDRKPAAGFRVYQQHPEFAGTKVKHTLYLPEDWKEGEQYPVIVEYAGNGGYKNDYGDVSTGLVEGSKLGYGLTGGKGAIWLCMPYLNESGTENVLRWWGDRGTHNPAKTVEYAKKIVPWICSKYGGDPERVVLCGFSRGAIACNFIGLHDDEIAALWCGFVPYSHYDGVRHWPFPGSDQDSARKRLKRLGDKPQFILHEGTGIDETRSYLESTGFDLGNIRLMGTGFRNHDDAWTLRPSTAREALRKWLDETLAGS